MSREGLLLGAVLGLGAAYLWALREDGAGLGEWAGAALGQVQEAAEGAAGWLGLTFGGVVVPEAYRATVQAAEVRHGLPAGLLGRVLWQESRFNPAARSPAGALGIAQFMPDTARGLGIDPMDPAQAIPAAAAMLARLYARFGHWGYAVAAYNWGEGNMQAFIATGRGARGQPMPAETRDYMAGIMGGAIYG